MLTCVYGENSSGKSRYAESLVAATHGPRFYIATMIPYGESGAKRVEKHRKQREDLGFTTVEDPELADPGNAPVVGGGLVLKFNANQRYTTDGISAAIFRSVCRSAGVPVQTYCNRADIPGGSTLGHISLAHVSVPTADIGLPQLAMHSCYETAGVQDPLYLEDAMAAYYGATLEVTGEGYVLK